MRRILLAGVVVALAPVTASAHDTTPIERKMERQVERIKMHRKSGDLTGAEYRKLLREQSFVSNSLRQARSDGNVTGKEYRKLVHAQHKARDNIYSEANDWQYSRLRRWWSNIKN